MWSPMDTVSAFAIVGALRRAFGDAPAFRVDPRSVRLDPGPPGRGRPDAGRADSVDGATKV
jgi:hypothetical protein